MKLRLVLAPLLSLALPSPAATHERPYVVVVDAGHGGHDPGALSPSDGRSEKEITIAIATAVRDMLGANHNIRIVLTRDDDRFLSLIDRRQIAECNHADLFVSIHADSSLNRTAHGASVYTLTEDGRAIVVSRMAAAATLDGIALAGLDADTAAVLGDLKQRGAMNDSVVFAALLSQEMERAVQMRAQFHQSAQFAVLKARGVPAVLIETGYITNSGDAATLYSKKGQGRIAAAIAAAIHQTSMMQQKLGESHNQVASPFDDIARASNACMRCGAVCRR